MTTTVAAFDDLIKSKSLLNHVFYQKWSAGELTMDDMKVYALEYFSLAKAVPLIVEHVQKHAASRRPDLLDHIEQNRVEEVEHIDLWKRFGNSLGLSDEEMEAYTPTQTVQDACASLEKTAELGFDEGVALMYALEAELPEVAKTKKDGLCAYYNLTSEDAHIYFDEHLGEEKHLAAWRGVELDPEKADMATRICLRDQNRVLDGVCEAAGIPCECAM